MYNLFLHNALVGDTELKYEIQKSNLLNSYSLEPRQGYVRQIHILNQQRYLLIYKICILFYLILSMFLQFSVMLTL